MSYLGPSLRRTRRRSRAWPRVATAIAVSLLVNALLLLGVRPAFELRPGAAVRSVALAPLSSSQWEANRAVRDPSSPAAPLGPRPEPLPQQPAPEPPRDPKGQVVEVAPSKDHTPPKDSRFVSDRDNTVDKETIARNRRAGFENTLPKPSDPKGAKAAEAAEARRGGEAGPGGRPPNGVADGASQKSVPGPQRLPEPKAGPKVALLDRNGDRPAQPEEAPQRAAGQSKRGDPGAAQDGDATGRGGQPGALDRSRLMPSAETYDRLAGGPAPDHVTGVDEGDSTFLNTREWKYASYFNRIKQAVASQWDPNRALTVRDPDGSRFAYRDRHTVLAVRLDDSGGLKDIHVVKSSGVDFLDDTAVDAFRRAQPFVNPPRGLADGHGEISFTFGFYLETGGGFRMYRAPSR